MVLEKDGEDHLERSCEKKGSIAHSQGGIERPISCVLRTWKRKHYIALCGELAFEEAVDPSQTRVWIRCYA